MQAGEMIRKARLKKGMTLTECAELLGIHKGSLSNIEHDKRLVGRALSIRLYRVLGVQIPRLRDEVYQLQSAGVLCRKEKKAK